MRRFKVKIGKQWFTVDIRSLKTSPVQVLVDGEPVQIHLTTPDFDISMAQNYQAVDIPDKRVSDILDTLGGIQTFIKSPLPGVILSVGVQVGDLVSSGEVVCVLEAMKMEQSILASRDGIVKTVHVQQGQTVTIGDALIELI